MPAVELNAPQDGLRIRAAGPWVRDKLAILANYLPAFGVACSGKARAWYYVDGLAGPGINHITDEDAYLWGSPMIALQAEPRFAACIALEQDRQNALSLEQRAAPFGERAIVVRGDVNVDLLPLMTQHVNVRAPCLCVLDPEGAEVAWSTIVDLSRFRVGQYRTELLILFNADGFARMLPNFGLDAGTGDALDRVFGAGDWQDLWHRREAGQIPTTEDMRTAFLRLYVQQLEAIGYRSVLHRDIRERDRRGRLKYMLLFATDNPSGKKIMTHCFERVFPREEQAFLPGFQPPDREV